MKKIQIILLFGFIGILSIQGQTNRNFTMFYGNALRYNPAAAGMFNGDFRAFTSYRNQWSAINNHMYKTINFSIDGKVLQKEQRFNVKIFLTMKKDQKVSSG